LHVANKSLERRLETRPRVSWLRATSWWGCPCNRNQRLILVHCAAISWMFSTPCAPDAGAMRATWRAWRKRPAGFGCGAGVSVGPRSSSALHSSPCCSLPDFGWPPIHGASGGMAAAPAAAQASPPTAPSAWDSASGAEVPLVVEARPELSGTIAEVDPEIYADHVVADLEGRGYQVHELTVQNLTLLRHTGPGYQSDEGQFNWEAVVSDSATGLVMVLHGSAVVTWGGSPHEVVMVSVY